MSGTGSLLMMLKRIIAGVVSREEGKITVKANIKEMNGVNNEIL